MLVGVRIGQRENGALRCEVPNLDGLLAGGQQSSAIGRELDGFNSVIVTLQTEQLLAPALLPEIAPLEAAQIGFARFWNLFLEQLEGLAEIVSLQSLVGQTDVRRVQVLAGDQFVSRGFVRMEF